MQSRYQPYHYELSIMSSKGISIYFQIVTEPSLAMGIVMITTTGRFAILMVGTVA